VGNRIIENTFWIYFTAAGLITLWMPIDVMARSFITDRLQQFFGYPKRGWTHALTRSRISRVLDGTRNMCTFMCLASVNVCKNPRFKQASLILATIAIVFCLLRGLPFFFITRCPTCPPLTP